jgi:hypothetical protein
MTHSIKDIAKQSLEKLGLCSESDLQIIIIAIKKGYKKGWDAGWGTRCEAEHRRTYQRFHLN